MPWHVLFSILGFYVIGRQTWFINSSRAMVSTSYITVEWLFTQIRCQTIQTVGLLDDWLLLCVTKEAKMMDRKDFSIRCWALKRENIGDLRKVNC